MPFPSRRVRPALAALTLATLAVSGCGSSMTVETVTAGATGAETVSSDAKVIADSGFRVATNGFSFPNYGNEKSPANLDGAAMQSLYGDAVCARTDGGTCSLTAVSKAFMKVVNGTMGDGHCFGMAALASLMQKGTVDPTTFGAPTAAQLSDTAALQETIARYFATQMSPTVQQQDKKMPVREVIDTLTRGWAQGEDYVLGIWSAVGEGGHAITPTSLATRPDGTVEIRVYDNNFPGVERVMLADPAADTWQYATAADPSTDPHPYIGSPTNHMDLTPLSAVTGPQQCPVCEQQGNRTLVMVTDRSRDLPVHLEITAPEGEPPVDAQTVDSLSNSDSTWMSVGTTGRFVVSLQAGDGQQADDVDIAVLGSGYVRQVSDVKMAPGQQSTMTIDPAGHQFTWLSTGDGAPTLSASGENGPVSYSFAAGLATLAPNTPVTVGSDPVAGTAAISVGTDAATSQEVGLGVERVDATADGTLTITYPNLAGGQTLTLDYGKWDGNSAGPISATLSTPGQPDQPVDLTG